MKVVFNIATIPDRKQQLLKTIDSIINQCDEVNVMLNLYEQIPEELKGNKKIKCHICDNVISDGYKFLCAKNYKDAYLFFIDDDIIFPEDYAEVMISYLERYGTWNTAISLHGRKFKNYPITSYYRDAGREIYHCLENVSNDVKVDFIGTGAMCCHSDLFKNFNLSIFTNASMADIIMSKYFVENKVDMYCVAHERSYLKYQKVNTTICGTFSKRDGIQTEIANSVYSTIQEIPSWKQNREWRSIRNSKNKVEIPIDEIHNETVSFIIPAYKSSEYIEECLDSIQKQNCKKEILVGVDGCEETLNKVKEIIQKYRDIRVYYFSVNHGTYIVLNTLMKLAVGDYLCIFGSDDIMQENLSTICLREIITCDILRCCGVNFNGNDISVTSGRKTMYGVQFFRREIAEIMGGYADWRCGADSDFLNRAETIGLKVGKTSRIVMFRRLHDTNVTVVGEYKKGSDYRNKVIELTDQRKLEKFTKEEFKTTTDCIEITK